MLLDLVESTIPEWMLAPGRDHWAKLMAAIAATFDALVEGVHQARLAAIPGQVDADTAPAMGGFLSVDALGLVGRDRRILRGLSERPEVYAGRLRRWLEIWRRSGTAWGLLLELQAVLGPDAGILRIVTAGGDWWSLDPSGVISTWNQAGEGFSYDPSDGTLTDLSSVPHAWDWDSATAPAPPDQDDGGRIWGVLYAPCNAPWITINDGTALDFGSAGDRWDVPGTAADEGSPDMGIAGLRTPRKWLDLVRHVIAGWKVVGIRCSHVIVSFDPDAFNPTSDSTPTSIPDGKWGYSTTYDATAKKRVRARFISAEYLQAVPDEG